MNMQQYVVRMAGHYANEEEAHNDILDCMIERGFQVLSICNDIPGKGVLSEICRRLIYPLYWLFLYRNVAPGSCVWLQVPNKYTGWFGLWCLFLLKQKKGITISVILHDEEILRWSPDKENRQRQRWCRSFQKYVRFMKNVDTLLVPTEAMAAYCARRYIDHKKIICFGLFDFVCEEALLGPAEYSDIVHVAGNLDAAKSGYVYNLKELDGVEWYLYGTHFDEKLGGRLTYKGCFSRNVLMSRLRSGYGLVWDGDSLDTCSGCTGNYLRFNSPYKLSLYLACGLPVIIWEEAAQAAMVKAEGCGICVKSLRDVSIVISSITEKQYHDMAENAWRIGKQLRDNGKISAALDTVINGVV